MNTGAENRSRGRPRTPGAEEKILAAALAEYGEHGWSGFTMDAVARRAGVGKSTVYLRWHDKDALLTDAVRLRSHEVADVDTGSLRGDLTGLATAVFQEFSDPEGWAGFRMVVDSASETESIGNFTREVSGVHREVIEGIFTRALDRGEVTGQVQPLAITDLIYGAALFYALGRRLDHRPPDEGELTARVADVVKIVIEGLP
ncbi:TetR/AcrR family transcriptional regulator [Nocardioides sp. CN2-186]|uniref:TetR/AcrR family transcriptional regulator n=1 Tax=Nocardioides tweenelious TaxID=3156607 RepID=UPI0032B60F8A